MTESEQHLQAIASLGSAFGKFILANGRAFEPDARTFKGRRMEAKNCFGNCAMRCLRDATLTYVEGLASRLIPVHHAWLMRDDGTIIDPTFRLSDEFANPYAYFGVPFNSEFLFDYLAEVRTYGLLDGMSKRSLDLMTGKVPAEAFIAKAVSHV